MEAGSSLVPDAYRYYTVASSGMTFLFMVTDSLEKLEKSNIIKRQSLTNQNLTQDEMLALKNLEKDTSIVIKPADKCGNLVVMDHQQYRSMCLTILLDERGYKILERDPTNYFHSELATILQYGLDNHLIDHKDMINQYEFLLPQTPPVATFLWINQGP